MQCHTLGATLVVRVLFIPSGTFDIVCCFLCEDNREKLEEEMIKEPILENYQLQQSCHK